MKDFWRFSFRSMAALSLGANVAITAACSDKTPGDTGPGGAAGASAGRGGASGSATAGAGGSGKGGSATGGTGPGGAGGTSLLSSYDGTPNSIGQVINDAMP